MGFRTASLIACAASVTLATACVVKSRRAPPPTAPTLQPVGAPGLGAQNSTPPPGPQPLGFASPASGPPVMLPPGVARGRPGGMHPGAGATYWIWLNRQGQWRVRTTTAGMVHFRGNVAGVSSPIMHAHPSRMELNDRIKAGPTGITFDFETAGHMDGFDFLVKNNGCVRFSLQTDGRPVRVVIGAAQLQPPTHNFVLCP